jgi:hypothetical protein
MGGIKKLRVPYYRSILTDMYIRELTFYYANIEMIKL